MSQVLDVHLDFRSPYSYLATPELPRLEEDFDIKVRLRFGGTENWHTGEHLKDAAERCGLNFSEMEEAIQDTSLYDREIAENIEARNRDGHWDVPTFVFNGEPFFGQDRIETLRWRLDKLGLRREGR